MPSVYDFAEAMFDVLSRHNVQLSDEVKNVCVRVIRETYPSERFYVPSIDSRNDPGRKQKIIEAARMLPTAVVAERYGVTTSWVNRVVKK